MYELERKARADHRVIRERLRERDVSPTAELVQVDTYLNHPARDFARTDEALRIRREHPPGDPAAATVELTYKGPRLETDAKTRVERTTSAGDPDELYAILTALGFEDVDAVRKRRTRYEYEGITICLDQVDGLGEFVEVEAESPTDAIETAADRLEAAWSDLGMDGHEPITTPYLTMLLDEPSAASSSSRHDPADDGSGPDSRSP